MGQTDISVGTNRPDSSTVRLDYSLLSTSTLKLSNFDISRYRLLLMSSINNNISRLLYRSLLRLGRKFDANPGARCLIYRESISNLPNGSTLIC